MRHLIAAGAHVRVLDAGPGEPAAPRTETLVESYRRLADVFHDILSEHSLDKLLERIADTLTELVPHDSLSIYQADEGQSELTPVLARDQWAEKIMRSRCAFGEGISGWAAQHREPVRTNQAHLDPRVKIVPGTPADEPEALITVPLIARETVKGVLNIYRLGEEATFGDDEFELATRFADAAALALDNAEIRARLEYQAQTDSLTGLYNHRYFHERLRAELTRASRARDSVAVLMLDIDDFKRVNDVFGHGAGDEILRSLAVLAGKLGQGITGHVAATGESLLVGDAANHPLGKQVPGTDRIDESQICVPLRFGTRVIGVIVLSKLGLDQFDEDDVRLLEVLAGHAAVALENASLYESARRE